MGGKAFTTATGSEPALVVPRMEPAVYFKLKAKYIELLRSLFRLVACPLEAPGKRDYGDIDIVVSDPDDTVFESIYQNLSSEKGTLSADPPAHDIRSTVLLHVLDARRHLSAAGAISYAVPHPEEKDAFVQLDINQISSDLHVWQVFHHSHGDLWNLLGTSVRAFGMTVTEDGLYVRDPDIEKLDKKRSRVFLTRDPAEILNFMSLDYDEWNKGWATEDEMFRYATKSRFFVPGLYMSKGDLKANDRKRLGQRPCFRRFVEEYVPYLVASQQEHVVGEGQPSSGQAVADSNDEKTWIEVDRDDIRKEMLKRFGAEERYSENHRLWIEGLEALDRKRAEKAERRAAHEAAYEAARLRKLEAELEGSEARPAAETKAS